MCVYVCVKKKKSDWPELRTLSCLFFGGVKLIREGQRLWLYLFALGGLIGVDLASECMIQALWINDTPVGMLLWVQEN